MASSVESQLVDVAHNGYFSNPMSRRAFLSVLAVSGIGVGLAACGKTASSSSTVRATGGTAGNLIKGTTYVDVTTLTNDFFVAFADGAKQMASALGLNEVTYEDNGNVNTALNQIGTVKASGGKQYFGTPASEAQVPATVKACQQAGIYYAAAYTTPAWYTPPDGGDNWVMFISPPSASIAYLTAKRLFQAMKGEGTVIHVPGQKGSSADVQRTAGFQLALKEFPNVNVVTTAPGNWVTQDAAKAFSDILPSVKSFQGVFAQNDSEAAGVISVLDAQNIKNKLVTGFDGNKQNIQYIAEGKQLLTSATIGGLTAGILGVAVFDAVNGFKRTLPERMMYQEAVLVTQNIASDMLNKIYSGSLPFDWAKMSRVLHKTDWDPQCRLTPIDPTQYWKGVPQVQYQLNPAWNSVLESSAMKTATQTYIEHFKSGPLLNWSKDAVYA